MRVSPAFFLANVLLEGGLVGLAAFELFKLRRARRAAHALEQAALKEAARHPEGEKGADQGGAEPP